MLLLFVALCFIKLTNADNESHMKINIPAKLGQFPFMAALLYGDYRIRCSGALLTPSHILSAARCMTNKDTDLDETKLKYVMAGDVMHNENHANVYQELREIWMLILHPEYLVSKSIQYDMGVIKVKTDFTMSEFLHFAKFGGYSPPGWWLQHEMYLTGWGEFKEWGDCSHRLHFSKVFLANLTSCGIPTELNLFCGKYCYGCTGAVGSPLFTGDDVQGFFLESRYSREMKANVSVFMKIYNELHWVYEALSSKKRSIRLSESTEVNAYQQSKSDDFHPQAMLLIISSSIYLDLFRIYL